MGVSESSPGHIATATSWLISSHSPVATQTNRSTSKGLGQSLRSAAPTHPQKACRELWNPVSGTFFLVVTLKREWDTLDKLFTGRKVILPLSNYI